MRLIFCFLTVVSMAMANFTLAATIPLTWERSARDDPAVNYPLRKFGIPSKHPLAHFYRSAILLSFMKSCEGIEIDEKVWNDARARINIAGIDHYHRDQKWGPTFSQYHYFTFDYLVHICAGAGTLFGPKGIMIANAIKGGPGKLRGLQGYAYKVGRRVHVNEAYVRSLAEQAPETGTGPLAKLKSQIQRSSSTTSAPAMVAQTGSLVLAASTGQPALPYQLKKFGAPSADPLLHFYRTGILFILMDECRGVKLRRDTWRRYRAQIGLENIAIIQRNNTWFQAFSQYNQFTASDLDHLCRGAEWLFGKSGVMLTNAVSLSGKVPRLKAKADPRNPYIQLNESIYRRQIEKPG